MTPRFFIAALVASLLVALVFLGPAACNKIFSQKKQIELTRGQAAATADSAEMAMNTISNVAAADSQTDATVATGQAEIAAAAKGQKGAAAKRAACRLKAYKDSPQCKEPKP